MSGGNNQQTIAECFTRGAKTGLNEYPLLYVPKPSDIPSSELAAFERNRICHGYYDSFLYISGIPYDLSKVRFGLIQEKIGIPILITRGQSNLAQDKQSIFMVLFDIWNALI